MINVMERDIKKIEEAHVVASEQLVLSDGTFLWGSDVYIAVEKVVTQAPIEKIIQLFLLKNKVFVLILLLFFALPKSRAQYVIGDEFIVKNTLFIEVGGNGAWFSANYDRIFLQKNRVTITGRLGVSYLGFCNTLTIPITFSALYGKRGYFLEIGSGPTFHHYPTTESTGFSTQAIIGFRYQPMEKNGFMFRIIYTPILDDYSSDSSYWVRVGKPIIGGSIGYTF